MWPEPTSSLAFALQFRGSGHWQGPDRGLLASVSTAIGEVPRVEARWLPRPQAEVTPVAATLHTEIALTGPTTFQATATIDFVGADAIQLSTVGVGFLLPQADGRRVGAALWRIDRGEGRFGETTGLVASLLAVRDLGADFEQQMWLIAIAGSSALADRNASGSSLAAGAQQERSDHEAAAVAG